MSLQTPKPAKPAKKRKYMILGAAKSAAAPPSELPPEEDPDPRAIRLFSKSRYELIAEAAFYRAERRGFRGGDSRSDWYEAEAEVEKLLRSGRPF